VHCRRKDTSFESMLCRREGWFDGSTVHPLALVSGVVLDEIHLLQSNPRGGQLRMLLERLRRLRSQAKRKGWTTSDGLQVVALSATAACPEKTLERFLGTGQIVSVPGSRELEMVTPEGHLPSAEKAVVDYVQRLGAKDEKILVFSNCRRRVDDLASRFKEALRPYRYEVHAHHGSLGQKIREAAERAAKDRKRVLLVATSTLELGIDIGDIDLVVLDGPAPDVSSLLQRVGRGGRRTQTTRLMACSSSLCEVLVNSAMIQCAREGDLGPEFDGPDFAVLIQQVACFILQGKRRDRERERILGLLESALGRQEAEALLDHVVAEGQFIEEDGRLRMASDLLERAGKGSLYSNIESVYGTSVVDDLSGGTLATGIQYRGGSSLNLGGQSLQVKGWTDNKILVNRLSKEGSGDAEWSYTTKAWARGPSQPHALRKYLGIPPGLWPLVPCGEDTLVFHLGGARRQAVIDLAARHCGQALKVNEWAIRLKGVSESRLAWIKEIRDSALDLQISRNLERLERELGRPRANRQLPQELRVREVREWLRASQEVEAILASRWERCDDDEMEHVLGWFGKAVWDKRREPPRGDLDSPSFCLP